MIEGAGFALDNVLHGALVIDSCAFDDVLFLTLLLLF